MVRWARWLGSAGSGSETTSTCQPSAASATPAWCSAAPQLRIACGPRAWAVVDGEVGQVAGVGGIGQGDDLDLPAFRGERDPGMVQRGATAQNRQPALRVGDAQLPAGLEVQVQTRVANLPVPRLA